MNFILVCVSLSVHMRIRRFERINEFNVCMTEKSRSFCRENREIEQKTYSFQIQHHLPSSAVGGAMKIKPNEILLIDERIRCRHVFAPTVQIQSNQSNYEWKKKTYQPSSIDYDANMKENMCTFFLINIHKNCKPKRSGFWKLWRLIKKRALDPKENNRRRRRPVHYSSEKNRCCSWDRPRPLLYDCRLNSTGNVNSFVVDFW